MPGCQQSLPLSCQRLRMLESYAENAPMLTKKTYARPAGTRPIQMSKRQPGSFHNRCFMRPSTKARSDEGASSGGNDSKSFGGKLRIALFRYFQPFLSFSSCPFYTKSGREQDLRQEKYCLRPNQHVFGIESCRQSSALSMPARRSSKARRARDRG